MRISTSVLLLAACLPPALEAQAAPTIARIEDSVIVMANGRIWKPGLYLIRHIYTLQAPGGQPFFVLLGVGCTDCDAEYEIVILRPLAQIPEPDTGLIGFAAPGRDTPMLQDSANAFRRQFFGHCLQNAPVAAVQLAHEEIDSAWVDSIRTVVPSRDSLIVRNYRRTTALEDSILRLVAAGACREYQVR